MKKSKSMSMSMRPINVAAGIVIACVCWWCMAQAEAAASTATTFNVRSYGAKADGVTDNTHAFSAAWEAACTCFSASVVVLVPQGRYLVGPVTFSGPCKSHMSVQVMGTIVAPKDAGAFKCGQHWLHFQSVQGLAVEGTGVVDGRGDSWWSLNPRPCSEGPTSLRFTATNNTLLRGLTSLNSKQFHVDFNGCNGARAHYMTIRAPADSPDTDGIHVGDSSHVRIFDVNVATGDDCVSLGPGTRDVEVRRVRCGPGHGISIGSLGMFSSFDVVSNVTVSDATLRGTTNGVRIKTWQGGNGAASDIVFENVRMEMVSNPIIIDQHYCPTGNDCIVGNSGGVRVSNVVYNNITGVSATSDAVVFSCSSSSPCTAIHVMDVNLSAAAPNSSPRSVCSFATGSTTGIVRPPPCL